MSIASQTGVIILAAGNSSRLGQPKQLVEFKGKTLIQNTLDSVSGLAFASIMLVLGANAKEILNSTDCSEAEVVRNTDWKIGMSTSLNKGLELLEKKHPELNYVLIVLSDQPYISENLIHRLLGEQAKTKASITASKYGDVLGVPVIFEQSHFENLKALKGDQGARKLIANTDQKIAFVSFEQGIIDVDTPEDLERLNELNQKKVCR